MPGSSSALSLAQNGGNPMLDNVEIEDLKEKYMLLQKHYIVL